MAVITVVGSSGLTVQVTVSGSKMIALGSAYAKQIEHAYTSQTFNSIDLPGKLSGTQSTQQAVITTGGAYELTQSWTNVVIGANGGPGGVYDALGAITAPLNQHVTIRDYNKSSKNILAGDAAGISYYGGGGGTFVSTVGDNLFSAATEGNWTIDTGDGNDTILSSNGSNIIDAGSGNNTIVLGTGANTVYSNGQDRISGSEGGVSTIYINGGSSTISGTSNTTVYDNADKGSTILLSSNSTVYGGNNSTVQFTGLNGTVIGATRDTISASGDLEVVYGLDQHISVNGALKFISGTGDTSITAGSGTIWGAAGFNGTLNSTNHMIFTANQPGATGNQLIDASGSEGTMEAWTGAGNNTVTGGIGSEHFVFGTQFDGSNGDSFATVTGGSGAANTFGVLAGHNGGDITITDFGSAAGNMFFMYNYKPADADKAVRDLLATATVAGGNTILQLDNNMKVTFLGVSDLDSTKIVIS